MTDTANRLYEQKRCPRCGAAFTCSASAKCWCYGVDVPAAVLDAIEQTWQSCLCPDCLQWLASNPEKSIC